MSLIKSIKKDQYEILQLNRGRANPINTEMVNVIRAEFARIEQDKSVRGVILTGNTPGFFSVGLDLKELFNYDEEQIREFWTTWEHMVMELTTFSKPSIAAINGYSPAGGCVLAVTCDYRLMAEGEKFVIGLNETGVGIVVPEYIFQLYAFWIGKRKAYQNLMEGKLLHVDEAHACKLVDEICTMEELLPRAEKQMQKLLRAPDNILRHSKINMRAELVHRLKSAPKVNIDDKLAAWFHPESRAVMHQIVESLSK